MTDTMPDDESQRKAGWVVESSDRSPAESDVPVRTPMYGAFNSDRYRRQGLIRTIEERSERHLICYVAAMGVPIDRDDTLGLVDLLHTVDENVPIDLLLHTSGGDIDAAEKMSNVIRSVVKEAEWRVIIPDYAKSAGTLLALGADSIVMSDTSELGPIDPQIVLDDGRGNLIRHRVQSYLDAYESHREALRNDGSDEVARMMLGKLDPATIKLFESVRDRARKLAEDQLKHGMFRIEGNYTKVAEDLIDTTRWLDHGQIIAWEDARDLGLVVEYHDRESEVWQSYWQLYCLQRLAVRDRQKLFESDYASLTMEATSP